MMLHPTIKSIARSVILWAPLWIATTALFGGLGLFYVLFLKGDAYVASQAMLVRDEANATMMQLGRFESQTQMKAAQETIMELARNHQVVRAALQTVGPAPRGALSFGEATAFPDDREVRSFANDCISLHAPNGIEFGNSEVIYLDVKAATPDRAIDLSRALCESLETQLREVRRARAASVVRELSAARQSAAADLEETTLRIRAVEQKAGPQLADLRGLTDAVGGPGVGLQVDQIETELRVAASQYDELAADLRMLESALADPSAYVLAPGDLMNSQPGLKKLREGLADAQLSTSQLSGRFTDAHPLVVAARDAQGGIERRLTTQLHTSKITLEQELETSLRRLQELQRQKRLAEGKIETLAAIRADYANLVSELKTRGNIIEGIERELAEAKASEQAAEQVSLVTRLDEPQVGDRPVGPGRMLIVLAAAMGGLFLGLGFVAAVTPLDNQPMFGRRASDSHAAAPQSVAAKAALQPALPSSTTPLVAAAANLQSPLAARPMQPTPVTAFAPRAEEPPVDLDIQNLLADDASYDLESKLDDDGYSPPTTHSSQAVFEQLKQVKEAFELSQQEGSKAAAAARAAKPAASKPVSSKAEPPRPAARPTTPPAAAKPAEPQRSDSLPAESDGERRRNPRMLPPISTPIQLDLRSQNPHA